MKNMRRTRRTVLAGIGTAALYGLAGCSSVPGLGDEDEFRRWLYDPTADTDEAVNGMVHLESPAALAAIEDYLHPDALADRSTLLADPGLDRDELDWGVAYGDNLLTVPRVRAYGGSFDADAAATTTATVFDTDPAETVGMVGNFDLVRYDTDQYGLHRDGEAACVDVVESEDAVREIAEARTESRGGLFDADESLAALLDRLDSETVTAFDFRLGDGESYGSGYSYSPDGETTSVRYAILTSGYRAHTFTG